MSVPAFKIFEEMLAQNYKPKQFNHNWLLCKLCENNKFLEARMVSDMMLQRDNSKTFNKEVLFENMQ